MARKIDGLRDTFRSWQKQMPVRTEFALDVLDALEDGRLPQDKRFSLNDVFNVLGQENLERALIKNPDPILKDVIAAGEARNTAKEALLVGQLALGTMCSAGDAVLNTCFMYKDDDGSTYDVSADEVMRVLSDGIYKHPITGEAVHYADESIFMFYEVDGSL